MGDYSGPGGGISPPAGDIGGTTSDPTVVSTHLTSPLPVAQGGTGSATQNFVDLTTNQTVDGIKTFSEGNTYWVGVAGAPSNYPATGNAGVGIGTGGASLWGVSGANSGWEIIPDPAHYPSYLAVNYNSVANGCTVNLYSANTSVFAVSAAGIVTKAGTNTTAPVYTSATIASGTALQISTTRDAIVSLDITYSTTSANTILVQTGPTSTPANTVFKKVKTTSTAEEDTICVDVKAGEYLLVTLTNATFTNATQVVKEV